MTSVGGDLLGLRILEAIIIVATGTGMQLGF